MSVRPSDLPEWGTDGGAEITEPPTPAEAEFVGGDPFFADYANWFNNLAFLWIEHFAEGVWADDIALTGSFDVDGDVTYTGSLAGGPATIGALEATSGDFSGDVVIAGDLDVDNILHGVFSLRIAASAGTPDRTTGGWEYQIAGVGIPRWESDGSSTHFLDFAVPLVHGDRVVEVRAHVDDTSVAGAVELSFFVSGSASVTLLGNVASDGSGDQVLGITGLTQTVAANQFLTVQVEAGGTAGNAVFGIVINYDRPV